MYAVRGWYSAKVIRHLSSCTERNNLAGWLRSYFAVRIKFRCYVA